MKNRKLRWATSVRLVQDYGWEFWRVSGGFVDGPLCYSPLAAWRTWVHQNFIEILRTFRRK